MRQRRSYKRPPIEEAICEFHFSPGQEWDFTIPGRLHTRLSSEYTGKPLTSALQAAFEAEPLEDGMAHPAEQIIRNVLENGEHQDALDLFSTFSLDTAHPGFAASILRCLGRQPRPGTVSWRATLVRNALTIKNVEIRDAAVQAAELWGDDEIRRVLEQHSEPESWLRDYVSDVLAQTEKTGW